MAQQTVTHHETLIREMFSNVLHEGKMHEADRYLTHDVQLHLVHKNLNSLNEWKELAQSTKEAFPDLRYELSDFVIEGEKAAFRWEGRGTHKGEFWGLLPTGKKLVWHGLSLYHFKGGKISQAWTYSNFSEIFSKLST